MNDGDRLCSIHDVLFMGAVGMVAGGVGLLVVVLVRWRGWLR